MNGGSTCSCPLITNENKTLAGQVSNVPSPKTDSMLDEPAFNGLFELPRRHILRAFA